MRLGLFSPLRRPKWPSASEMAKPTGNESNEGYFIVLNNIFKMTISVSRAQKFWDECYCGRHHLCESCWCIDYLATGNYLYI